MKLYRFGLRFYYMRTIRADHAADPGEVLGTGSERAVWSSPLRLAIQPDVAVAVGVHLAGAVVRAMIFAQSTGSPASDVSHHFPPELCFERGSAGWDLTRLAGRLSGWLIGGLVGRIRRGLLRGYTRRLTTGLRSGLWSRFISGHCSWLVSRYCSRYFT